MLRENTVMFIKMRICRELNYKSIIFTYFIQVLYLLYIYIYKFIHIYIFFFAESENNIIIYIEFA